MRLHFVGKDPESRNGQSPALYSTTRTDRRTWGIQGWTLTDPEALADVRDLGPDETIIEVPEEILEMYVQMRQQGDR